MKINKQSIQYKAVNALFERPSNNLCIYFWQLISISVMGIYAILATIGFFVLPYAVFYHPDIENADIWIKVFTFFGVFPWGMIGVIIFIAVFYVIHLLLSKGSENIVGEYIKAKKDKICPRIEFED